MAEENLNPSSSDPLDTIVVSIKAILENASSATHERVVNTLSRLLISVERPIDVVVRLHEGQMPLAIVKSAIDAGIFNALSESERALSAEQVATKVGAASSLTVRLLRYLSAQGLVTQVDKYAFVANSKTKAFAQPAFQGSVNFSFETTQISQAAPAFLVEHKFQDIIENTETPFNKAFNTPLPLFEWFQHNPKHHENFIQYMSIRRHDLVTWLSLFPVESEIGDWKAKDANSDSDLAAFIDIGGGIGQQAVSFSEKYPDLGRVVVQDLPSVLEYAQLPVGVEKQASNFFKGQPEKGAKFYYLRNILHDYPDEKVLVILKHLLEASGPDSQILIDEMCLPEQGVTLLQATIDFRMGFLLGAVERTLGEWEKLLDAAGLKIKSKYQYTEVLADTVIVAVPK